MSEDDTASLPSSGGLFCSISERFDQLRDHMRRRRRPCGKLLPWCRSWAGCRLTVSPSRAARQRGARSRRACRGLMGTAWSQGPFPRSGRRGWLGAIRRAQRGISAMRLLPCHGASPCRLPMTKRSPWTRLWRQKGCGTRMRCTPEASRRRKLPCPVLRPCGREIPRENVPSTPTDPFAPFDASVFGPARAAATWRELIGYTSTTMVGLGCACIPNGDRKACASPLLGQAVSLSAASRGPSSPVTAEAKVVLACFTALSGSSDGRRPGREGRGIQEARKLLSEAKPVLELALALSRVPAGQELASWRRLRMAGKGGGATDPPPLCCWPGWSRCWPSSPLSWRPGSWSAISTTTATAFCLPRGWPPPAGPGGDSGRE